MTFYEGRDYRLVEELMDRCMSGEASQVSAYLADYNWAHAFDRMVMEHCLMIVCDSYHDSPAREGEKVQIATMLIDKGTSVGLLGRALIAACRHRREELASLLLDRGADPNRHAPSYGPPLVIVCRRDHPHAFARMLLDCGADPCLCDGCGRTPLHLAMNALDLPNEHVDRRVDNARLLLERGAGSTIYRKDRWGRTPIDLARGQPRMIALLRKYFTIIVRKYVIGGNAEHPSRNRMKHLALQMASFLIPDPILI